MAPLPDAFSVNYVIADNPPVDVIHYRDSNKWLVKPNPNCFTLQETAYFSGEE